jgi:hypothetical protein
MKFVSLHTHSVYSSTHAGWECVVVSILREKVKN